MSNLNSNYRPKNFKEVIGQEVPIKIFIELVKKNKLPQQILFTGNSGIGKTTLGRILGKAILCKEKDFKLEFGMGCEKCPSCLACLSGNNPDLIEIDAASNGGKDEILDISSKSNLMPLVSDAKVYLIDEVHGLSSHGSQAFLKLLEEPPKAVYFILCTTDPEKILPTIRGRCLEFNLNIPSKEEIINFISYIALQEGEKLSESECELIIDTSDKSFGVRGIVSNLGKFLVFKKTGGEDFRSELGKPNNREIDILVNSIFTNDDKSIINFYIEKKNSINPTFLREELISKLIIKDYSKTLIVDLLLAENNIDNIFGLILKNINNDNKNLKNDGKLDIFWSKVEENYILFKLLKNCEVNLEERFLTIRANSDDGSKLTPYIKEIKNIIKELELEPKFEKNDTIIKI